MKQNYFIVALLIATIFISSCQKEQLKDTSTEGQKSETPTDYKKEIIVLDKSGENSIFLSITSSNIDNLEDFISSNNLELKIVTEKIEYNNNFSGNKSDDIPSINYENTVDIEVVKTNLKDPNTAYSLSVENSNIKELKSTNSYSVTYTDYADYMTIVHRGNGSEIGVEGWYTNSYFGLWYKEFAGYIRNAGAYYARIYKPDSYKTRLFVQRWEDTQYYDVFYAPNARGHACLIGEFDENNYGECYLGTAPVGTNPFFYRLSSIRLAQYYTPLSGNSCPYPGSHFDGANCYVRDIPNNSEYYTWSNNWLIKSNYIF